MGVKAEVLLPGTDCHHFVLEDDWSQLEMPYGSFFLSIPTILDSSLAPEGHHILHIFTTSAIDDWKVGSPKTHRRFLAWDSGTYGPMPRGIPKGLLGMPFNTTGIDSLYCVGDSCFPGERVIAVAFSGFMCAHRVAAEIGLEQKSPVLDTVLLHLLRWLRSLA